MSIPARPPLAKSNMDAFLALDGIKGESQDSKHKDEIEVLSWSWKVTNQGTAASGMGSGAGKVNAEDIHFIKRLDKSSAPLLQHCATGKPIGKGTITIRKAGGDQQEFLTIELTNVFVSAFEAYTPQDESPAMMEQVSLNFAQYLVTYKPQNADGSLGAPVQHGFNLAKNQLV